MSLIFPYLTLQALGLGLTYEDISIIYGISPVIALTAGPISGKQFKLRPCLIAQRQGLLKSSVKFPLADGQNYTAALQPHRRKLDERTNLV